MKTRTLEVLIWLGITALFLLVWPEVTFTDSPRPVVGKIGQYERYTSSWVDSLYSAFSR